MSAEGLTYLEEVVSIGLLVAYSLVAREGPRVELLIGSDHMNAGSHPLFIVVTGGVARGAVDDHCVSVQASKVLRELVQVCCCTLRAGSARSDSCLACYHVMPNIVPTETAFLASRDSWHVCHVVPYRLGAPARSDKHPGDGQRPQGQRPQLADHKPHANPMRV